MISRRCLALVLWAASPLLFSAACKNKDGNAAPASANATNATNASAAPSSALPVAKAKPWYSGGFSGKYEARLAPVEVKVGAVREWLKDDGARASGPGQLSLRIDDEGSVLGSSEGALGKSEATGKVEDNTLLVQLTASDANGFAGVLVATREGDGFKGTISASSADSLTVRKATVELAKLPN